MESVDEKSEIIVQYSGPIQIIKFNRPQRKNAITSEGYYIIRKALQSAAENNDVKISFVTGVGDYFSSGNDFGQSSIADEDIDITIRNRLAPVREILRCLIDYPKILIAFVNGPAIGIAVTMLPLFDLVYASENATFRTPFSSLGITAEGCSTYTFSRCLGKSLAAKMLYFNYTMTAKEAKDSGFVADVISNKDLPKFMNKLQTFGELPLKALVSTKQMSRSHDLKSLHYANTMEAEKLVEMFQSEDFINAMLKLKQRKITGRSKL
ncbi:enoyl-CoA delta isomerase 2 [Halyomorpha halys]|uniref:enoyl-CoA delta isomerase 2 n=1 Tax=Halyomorpha halys TaxID=286706 RepID=UPI0006D503E5|nr:enoyl-CoA delta isomerase 2, mitochondrial [Halyomorpha halys]